MVIRRGEIWWAELPDPVGSGPGYRRPVLVVQSNEFNRSLIGTAVVVVLTSNLKLKAAPGNLLLKKRPSRLPRDSVINVSQILTIDKKLLTRKVSSLAENILKDVEQGMRLVLAL